MSRQPEVIVVGAGAAGLAAASKLAHGGVSVSILEARERIGGRIFTHHPPSSPIPIELGAEFIHGFAPEILEPLQKADVAILEVDGDSWCVSGQRLSRCDFFGEVDAILKKMDDGQPDESFLAFLDRCCPNPKGDPRLQQVKRRALGYITGFNAADPALVGVHWLLKGMRAEEEIEGDRAFRPTNGYAALIDIFRRQLADTEVPVHTSTVVKKINWARGKADVTAHTAKGTQVFTASQVVVTLPLAVLKASSSQAGATEFIPSLPAQKLQALDKLETGKVIRVVLRFRHRFWETIAPDNRKTLSEMSFLFSDDEWFPTWWTTMPRKLPIITGWAPFRAAERLSGHDRSFIIEHSLQTLSRLLKVDARETKTMFEDAYFHDWQADPFSLGAYSYARVGADHAQEALAAPLDNTLFFAGEATDITGNNGTVHGAIASGYRAAAEIFASRSVR